MCRWRSSYIRDKVIRFLKRTIACHVRNEAYQNTCIFVKELFKSSMGSSNEVKICSFLRNAFININLIITSNGTVYGKLFFLYLDYSLLLSFIFNILYQIDTFIICDIVYRMILMHFLVIIQFEPSKHKIADKTIAVTIIKLMNALSDL